MSTQGHVNKQIIKHRNFSMVEQCDNKDHQAHYRSESKNTTTCISYFQCD